MKLRPRQKRARCSGTPCLLAVVSAVTLACNEPAPVAPAPSEETATSPNFLLIVVDTLRADRLGFAGYPRGESPSFDALQGESVWFRNAYATSSWTLPSTASLFTSRFASDHRVSNWGARLGARQPTLVGELDRAGYRTAMWTANRVVSGRRGFARRFQQYQLVEHPDFKGDPPLTEAAFGAASTLADAALHWLRAGAASSSPVPFFAYLHFMEPHAPYLCPKAASADCEQRALALNRKILDFDWELDSEERALLGELYDAEISRMDTALRMLLEALRNEGHLSNTWLVLVSDHGELLGESGMYMHGRTLYEAMVHVPLLVRKPSGTPARVDVPVSLIDVAPTLLDLAGLPMPDAFVGRSLRPALEGGTLTARPVVSELLPLKAEPDPRQKHFVAVRNGTDKFILRVDGVVERFDLSSDPGESEALSASREEFELLLESAGVDFDQADYTSPDIPEPTPNMRKNLKALGYLR